MLYKYYRYILLLKIILLSGGVYLVMRQGTIPTKPMGTYMTFSTQHVSKQVIDRIVSGQYELPLPWSVGSSFSGEQALHIPWTDDTGYVLQYLQRPLPLLHSSEVAEDRLHGCKVLLSVNEANATRVKHCSGAAESQRNPRLLLVVVLLGLFL